MTAMRVGTAFSRFLPLLSLLAADGARYKARVVAGMPPVPDTCDLVSCKAQPVPLCKLQIVIEEPIRQAAAEGVDILVFPETYFADAQQLLACGPPDAEHLIPEPSSQSLCPDSSNPKTWWSHVACWAKTYHVLVVVGTYEWGPCLPSPNPFTHRTFPCWGNLSVFNVAAAFGVDGQLLALHHKHHLAHAMLPTGNASQRFNDGLVVNPSPLELLNDDPVAQWPIPDTVTFTSHFGVTFGILICHELNFGSPILSLLKAGVRDVIFPTWWGGIMEGSFQGLQSGFAVAHGVNLISANGYIGGSGLWPADASATPVQYPVSSNSDVVPPQWFGTLDLTSPTGSVPRLPALSQPPAHKLVSNVSQLIIVADSESKFQVALDGIICQLDVRMIAGGGGYLFGASTGINAAGLFESTCWLASCRLMSSKLFNILSPSFLNHAHWPYSEEDLKFCAGQPENTVRFQDLQIHIHRPAANLFLPIGQCSNGLVPLPRPSLQSPSSEGWRTMALADACPLDFTAVRGFAQSEFEEPQCPEGFCPSPSLCSDAAWDTTDQARCTLVPAARQQGEVAMNRRQRAIELV